jgi:uncharacterized membrane protein YphA (DoxX/SURF4 family)
MMRRLFSTSAPRATILIRLLVAIVFASEGLQKFLLPMQLGAGRFARIGIPAPEVLAPFVGGVEIVGGLLVLLGLWTRPAAFALLINISVAIVSTKVPILLGHGVCHFQLAKLDRYGWLSALHESRTDLSMWLACLFLLIVGAGAWSFDARQSRQSPRQRP